MRCTTFLISCCLSLLAMGVCAQSINESNADITGLWKGTLYNDTTKLYYRYEIAISEEKKGKLSGFSHTWFILDDQQFYGVKKLKIRRDGAKLITEDAVLVAHNYPVEPAKGVRQLNVLTLELTDSLMVMSGPFTTNQTRVYSPLTGHIKLERKNDYRQSSLVPHLQELGLEKNLSFVKPIEPEPVQTMAIVRPAQKADAPDPLIADKSGNAAPAEKEQALQKKDINYQQRINEQKTELPVAIIEKEKTTAPVTRPVPSAEKPPEPKPVTDIKQPQAAVSVPATQKEPALVKPSAASEAEKRTTVVQQVVSFRSDSLQLSLYDNGEVDGDTVSVLMNGQLVIERQGLSTRAFRKTVYIPAGSDSVQLIMYAESLGQIPPNTGLLVIKDGRDQYEIRFSGDLQRNAGILLKRKKEY